MTAQSNPSWRNSAIITMIISSLISILLIVLTVFLAVINKDLIKKTSLPDFLTVFYNTTSNGFNIALTIIFIISYALVFFFTVIAYGSYTELKSKLPSWGEIFIPGILVPIIAWFVTNLTAASEKITLVGSGSSTNVSNFTTAMKWTILGVLILLEILLTLYLYYTGEE